MKEWYYSCKAGNWSNTDLIKRHKTKATAIKNAGECGCIMWEHDVSIVHQMAGGSWRAFNSSNYDYGSGVTQADVGRFIESVNKCKQQHQEAQLRGSKKFNDPFKM